MAGVLFSIFVVGAVYLPLPVPPFDVIETSILLIEAGSIQDEDVYVASGSGRVEGRIEGDLVIATGDLTIDGVVTGDVLALSHGTVRIGGRVLGSVRGLARSIEVAGTIAEDLAVVAFETEVSGSVGRDFLVAGGKAQLTGGVGRDVRGRAFDLDLSGSVGRDVDVTVRSLDLDPGLAVAGDLLYRSDDQAAVPEGATVGGITTRLTTRGSFLVRLYLTLAYAMGFIVFVLIGFLGLWLFRASGSRAAGAVITRPGRTLVVGLLAGVVLPFAVVFSLLFAGSTLATIVVGTLVALLLLVGLALGPVPALAAFGNKLTGERAGLFGGFLVATITWRALAWLIPFAGAVIGLAVYTWGIGAWLVAGWDDRARALDAAPLVPDMRTPETEPADWEPPLPPA